MVEKVKCFVTSSKEDAPAFAIRADTDESVFIPQHIAEMLQLEEMDTVMCLIAENKIQPDKTPWYAQKVKRIDDA